MRCGCQTDGRSLSCHFGRMQRCEVAIHAALAAPPTSAHTCPTTPSMTQRNSGVRSNFPTAKFLICHKPCRPNSQRQIAVKVCCASGYAAVATNKSTTIVEIAFLAHGSHATVHGPVVCWRSGVGLLRLLAALGCQCSGRLQAGGCKAQKHACHDVDYGSSHKEACKVPVMRARRANRHLSNTCPKPPTGPWSWAPQPHPTRTGGVCLWAGVACG